MKRVIRTNKPSLKQCENMSYNLTVKYGEYSSIEIQTKTYKDKKFEIDYWLSVNNTNISGFSETWSEIQDRYFKLMEE